MIPRPAETVTYLDGQPWTFDVDNEEFPFYISEEGARISKLRDDLYQIDITILAARKGPYAGLNFSVNEWEPPKIDGIYFPWTISADGFTYQRTHKTVPTLKLGFFTYHIKTNIPIHDANIHGSPEIYGLNGNYFGTATSHAHLWAETHQYT